MAAATDLVRVKGDRWRAIRGAFEQRSAAGTWVPIPLTDATITFRMVAALAPYTEVVDWGPALIEDATAGLVYYAPAEGDVDTAGEYLAWFRVTKDGLTLTAPADGFRIVIRPVDPP